MSRFDFVRVPFLLLLFSFCTWVARADFEAFAMGSVMSTLDHYMQAGADGDARRGAELLEAFEMNKRRAEYDTQRLFRQERSLFSDYVSISNDIYGFEIDKGLLGATVEVEGGIETGDGVTAEFKARVVYRKQRWLIAVLEID